MSASRRAGAPGQGFQSAIWGIFRDAESVRGTSSLTFAGGVPRMALSMNGERDTLHSIERPAGDAPPGHSLTSVHAPLPDFTPKEGRVVKKVLVGLALALALTGCGTALQTTANAVDYSRLDTAMNQHPDLVIRFCDAHAQLLADGASSDRIYDFLEEAGGFDTFPDDLGLTHRQIYHRIVSRC
jgi:hypothetical protein